MSHKSDLEPGKLFVLKADLSFLDEKMPKGAHLMYLESITTHAHTKWSNFQNKHVFLWGKQKVYFTDSNLYYIDRFDG